MCIPRVQRERRSDSHTRGRRSTWSNTPWCGTGGGARSDCGSKKKKSQTADANPRGPSSSHGEKSAKTRRRNPEGKKNPVDQDEKKFRSGPPVGAG